MSLNLHDVKAELYLGGRWLGATREWMQHNVNRGDSLPWGSGEPVTLPFAKLEELALVAAAAALLAERQRSFKP